MTTNIYLKLTKYTTIPWYTGIPTKVIPDGITLWIPVHQTPVLGSRNAEDASSSEDSDDSLPVSNKRVRK